MESIYNDKWINQLKKGLLEFCVLLILTKKSTYGYELTRELNEFEIFSVSEGAIYPILRRLLENELISSYWVENTEGGPPRKYYKITLKGEKLKKERWDVFTSMYNFILMLKEDGEE
ncbi:PadR family transcriptional regulator [Bacillus anthracis]|uniref:PadR family transcriptional regulator n=1 Tax=Bacillus cereus group TaxID=86661 RepID=UPI001F577B5B|nr:MULTISPECIES: PadR family transcriptional regulator [Bacillus cereus group]MEB9505266.1 PadR family transcriptional regulator [Bacillus anthracis]